VVVSLTPELEEYVNQKVGSGMYHSASEVIREGLRMLKEVDDVHHRKIEELRGEIQIGIDEADRGKTNPLTGKVMADIKARGRKRRANRARRSPA
jgi:antitoxin ParD1/3/4